MTIDARFRGTGEEHSPYDDVFGNGEFASTTGQHEEKQPITLLHLPQIRAAYSSAIPA
jgi:hypothetical protein